MPMKIFAGLAITLTIVVLVRWALRSSVSGGCKALVWGAGVAFMRDHHRWPTRPELAASCDGYAFNKEDPTFSSIDARHAYMEVNDPTILGTTRVRVPLVLGPNGQWLFQR